MIGSAQSQPFLANMGTPSSDSLPTTMNGVRSPKASASTSRLRPLGSKTPPRKRPPLKSSSFQRTRSSPVDTAWETSEQRSHATFRAAERGSGDVLPMTSSVPDTTPNRIRSFSTNNNEHRWQQPTLAQRGSSSDSSVAMHRELRSRRKTPGVSERSVDENASHQLHNVPLRTWSDSADHRPPKPVRSRYNAACRRVSGGTMNRAGMLQMGVIAIVTLLVWDSYRKATQTSSRLTKFKDEEDMLMLHLQRIEQQTIGLNEDLRRLSDQTGNQPAAGTAPQDSSDPIDAELLRVRTQQLYDMEDELSHELTDLKKELQQSAKKSIVSTFGEGPIQVHLDLNFPGGSDGQDRISVYLWPETPYAAWTLLQQVNQGIWRGADFKLGKGYSLEASPSTPDNSVSIGFVEKTLKTHEAWTVGLSEAEGGGLKLFINIQDNTAYHKFDVCVGKVVDGFDTLRKLVDVTRNLETGARRASVRMASVTHLTKSQLAGLM